MDAQMAPDSAKTESAPGNQALANTASAAASDVTPHLTRHELFAGATEDQWAAALADQTGSRSIWRE